MPKITLEGVPPLDGSYTVEPPFTLRELHLIKEIAGVRAGELEEASAAGDTDLIVALTVIGLMRAGKGTQQALAATLWEADAGAIRFEDDEPEEPDADPQTSAPASASSAEPDSSGPDTGDDSDPSRNGQNPTGMPDSAIGVTWHPATSPTSRPPS
jgi:hypothetical protein